MRNQEIKIYIKLLEDVIKLNKQHIKASKMATCICCISSIIILLLTLISDITILETVIVCLATASLYLNINSFLKTIKEDEETLNKCIAEKKYLEGFINKGEQI